MVKCILCTLLKMCRQFSVQKFNNKNTHRCYDYLARISFFKNTKLEILVLSTYKQTIQSGAKATSYSMFKMLSLESSDFCTTLYINVQVFIVNLMFIGPCIIVIVEE